MPASRGRYSVKLDGFDKVIAKLGKLTEQALAGVADALEEEAAKIIYAAREYVPIETGELSASGAVKVEQQGYQVTAVVSFGGPPGTGNVGASNTADVNYAAAVHEIPPPPAKSPGGRSARHGADLTPPKPANQQYKYLEKGLADTQPGLKSRFAKRARRKIK